MLHLSSPSPPLLSQISPSFRSKRIPSSQATYSSNQNLKLIKTQSPSKLSEKLKRRKSQYINSNSYMDLGTQPAKKKSSKSIHNQSNRQVGRFNDQITTKNVVAFINNKESHEKVNQKITSNFVKEMNSLKNQYKLLKTAYTQLLQQKISNVQKIAQLKQQKSKLQSQLELFTLKSLGSLGSINPSLKKPSQSVQLSQNNLPTHHMYHQLIHQQNKKLKQKTLFYQTQLQRIKKQCYKLLQSQRFKCKKLQLSLKEKDLLITQLKGDNAKIQLRPQFGTPRMIHASSLPQAHADRLFDKVQIVEESLFISQDKTHQHIGNSQFISISLTSVMDQSATKFQDQNFNKNNQNNQSVIIEGPLIECIPNQTMLNTQLNLKREKSHSKGVDYNITHSNKVQRQIISCHPIKKLRKQVHQKLQINLNHYQNMKKQPILSLKTPLNNDKKSLKSKNSKSKKKQEQNKQNYHLGKQLNQNCITKTNRKKDKHQMTHK